MIQNSQAKELADIISGENVHTIPLDAMPFYYKRDVLYKLGQDYGYGPKEILSHVCAQNSDLSVALSREDSENNDWSIVASPEDLEKLLTLAPYSRFSYPSARITDEIAMDVLSEPWLFDLGYHAVRVYMYIQFGV